MLVILPKDVLAYILSITVYETYVEKYPHFAQGHTITENVAQITNGSEFDYHLENSEMATAVKRLSDIHPTTQKLLKAATKHCGYSKWWGFRAAFFRCLCATEEK